MVRLWDLESGRCLQVLEGHSDTIYSTAWSPDGRHALSGSEDSTVRLWDLESGRCLRTLAGHHGIVYSVAWSPDGRQALSGDSRGEVRTWDLVEIMADARPSQESGAANISVPEQVQYTNAKVLLIGESGAGKTGLSNALTGQPFDFDRESLDSTVGAWATHWKLPLPEGTTEADGVEREIWLWDFGGQADQRLIHQLYMDETALAVLVFDGQKDFLFETLGQWDRDLTQVARTSIRHGKLAKLLVAGRVDASMVRGSRSQVEAFAKERGYGRFIETSARTGQGCEDLSQAIVAGINWQEIAWRTSPLLFKRLKEEIVKLKDAGRVLLRFNELREALQLRLAGEMPRFTDDELHAVISLLAGPGVVWELTFGAWVLLQPALVNAYAQAVIQTMRADELERGCISEQCVLDGKLSYQSSAPRLEGEEERFVLLAMHQTLVERGLCLREQTEQGPMLIFPSYYRRERPDLVGHPAVHVSYQFNGFLDDIYATLVVRLHHTSTFEQHELWRYAADFKTPSGRKLGVKLTRRSEGDGEIEVYFDLAIDLDTRIVFSRYVHEHLVQKARDVVRLRHYVCPHCGTPVGNREVAMERLDVWLQQRRSEQGVGWSRVPMVSSAESPTIICARCEQRVPLWDVLEASIVLDNESKERALVGEVISTVALAGQISREFAVSDHGIDMEVEFKSDAGEATGRKLYLQLKSGDSYLRKRQRDGTEVFEIPKERHAQYWMGQAFPVLLVIRTSDGEVRWMEVRDHLRRESDDGQKAVRQIIFDGERFDVMSVRRWRDRMLRDANL
jgi:GTPase SAR1 family protein